MILVYLQSEINCFSAKAHQVEFFNKLLSGRDTAILCEDETDFLRRIPEASAVIVWTFKQEWFALAPGLRDVYTPAAGRDYFKVVPPANVSMHYGAFHGKIMGETALGAILAMTRGLLSYAGVMKGDVAAHWPRTEIEPRCRMLNGSTVMILGFGNIGKYLAEMLSPFEVRLICITNREHPEYKEEYPAGYTFATLDSLDEYLSQADHIVCFLPSAEKTDNLLSEKRLALLKPTAYLYNFGRGNLIDEKALAERLQNGKLGGAILDVFKNEPLPPSSPLREAPNCFLYPHSSAFTPGYLDLYLESLVN